jgi:hypothetical protein
MSWLSIAANFLRDAMSSDDSSPQTRTETPPPEDIAGLVGLMNRHRAETEQNFERVAQFLRAQNEQYARTIQLQRRWNYGLAAALLAVAILAVAAYIRH